jgi:hypothetical protein
VTTPREQLIEAIADKLASIRLDGRFDENGVLRIDADALAEGALEALSDLGALAIMPVTDPARARFVDGQTVFHRQTHLANVGQPDYANYYVNALESEGEG